MAKTTKQSGKVIGNRDDKAEGERVAQIAALIERAVKARLGPNLTFEQRQNAAAEIMAEALHKRADDDLKAMVTEDDEVDIEGTRYRRLGQPSSASYVGRWGAHFIKEALYRQVGARNGPTVKPIELRAGIIAHMTPDMARIVGELSAAESSRQLEQTLRATGHTPPSRTFLENRVKELAGEMTAGIARLEASARTLEEVPPDVASVSCGLDRMSVRMSEPASEESASERTPRTEPYERTPPPPKDHHWRKAWVGSVTLHNTDGVEIRTLRYGTNAGADPDELADRVAADVAVIARQLPGVQLHCIQDAAPELRALPRALERALPPNKPVVQLVDFHHVVEYLDKVVDACEPEGDRNDSKSSYRSELLADDSAIDRIFQELVELDLALQKSDSGPPKAVAEALSYIGKRRDQMRYAAHYANNLPIGSGATESTCWQMQQRVARAGQSWEPQGLGGVMGVRGLVLSGRWEAVWPTYAQSHLKAVRLAA